MLNLFQPPAGLLGSEEEAVRQQMQMQGLLGLASGFFQSAQPSPVRQSIGTALTQGLAAGQQAANSTLTNALQMQEYARQRQEQDRLRKAREQFDLQLQSATTSVPTTGLVPGSAQSAQLAKELQGFSPQDVSLTQQALMSAGATQQVTDQAAADQAVMNYLRQVSPVEYAKLIAKEPRQLPSAIQEFAFARTPEGGNFKGSFQQFLQSKTPSTNVSLSTEKSYGGALAGEVAKSDAGKFEAAQAAPRMIESAQNTKKLIESGKVFTGFGATQKLDLARAGNMLGITGKDTNEIISNTQRLLQNRARATLDAIKSSGLGSGQGFTDKDRQFLENAQAGGITYDKKTLLDQVDIEERVAKAAITNWNNRIKQIPAEARGALGLQEVPVPQVNPVTIRRYNPATGRIE